MLAYLKLIRIPNLIIVAALQAILYFGILIPVFDNFGIKSILGGFYFMLLILTTLLITAAGYVINDVFDEKTDKINKAGKYIISRYISKRHALLYYLLLIAAGFVIAFIIAIHIDKIAYMLIYILAVVLLYFYSKYFKKQILTGNVFVSLFSAFVPGIILVFELPALIKLREIDLVSFHFVLNIFLGYMLFSFFVSMYRELVKDMEDIEGDEKNGAKTFPVVFGIELTKLLSGLLSIIILILLFYWLNIGINLNRNILKIYVLVFVTMPLFYSVFLLKNAKTKKDFHKLSGVIKIIMATGISILFFYM